MARADVEPRRRRRIGRFEASDRCVAVGQPWTSAVRVAGRLLGGWPTLTILDALAVEGKPRRCFLAEFGYEALFRAFLARCEPQRIK